jgi:hypothetical protein
MRNQEIPSIVFKIVPQKIVHEKERFVGAHSAKLVVASAQQNSVTLVVSQTPVHAVRFNVMRLQAFGLFTTNNLTSFPCVLPDHGLP